MNSLSEKSKKKQKQNTKKTNSEIQRTPYANRTMMCKAYAMAPSLRDTGGGH